MVKEKETKPHKVLKALLIIFVFLIICIIAIYIWQKDNVDAFVNSIKYSQEDIQEQIDDSKISVEAALKEYDIEGLRDFTFEEEEQIRRGEITYEEALKKIVEESGMADKITVVPGDNSSNQESGASQSNQVSIQSSGTTAQDVVSEYAVKLYGLKAYYLGQLGNLVDQAKAEYKSGASLGSLATKYFGKAASLEGEADNAVDSILNELKSKLVSMNADTSVISSMKSAYNNEKTLKKSYYLSLYQNKK